MQPLAWTSDVFSDEGLHYVTLHHHVTVRDGEPRVCEPDKVDEWLWVSWDDPPRPTFTPAASLWATGWRPPNALVTVTKLIGGLLSGSAALLAEAAHSIADTTNQGFLLVSISMAERPTPDQPFGYGRVRFLWTFIAAITMFVAGSVFAIGWGIYDFASGLGDAEIERASGEIERRLRDAVPDVTEVFLDATTRRGTPAGST